MSISCGSGFVYSGEQCLWQCSVALLSLGAKWSGNYVSFEIRQHWSCCTSKPNHLHFCNVQSPAQTLHLQQFHAGFSFLHFIVMNCCIVSERIRVFIDRSMYSLWRTRKGAAIPCWSHVVLHNPIEPERENHHTRKVLSIESVSLVLPSIPNKFEIKCMIWHTTLSRGR